MYANIYERRHTHPTPIYKHVRKTNLGLYLVPKKFAQYPSQRIFEHIHETLNAVEKIINYTV